MNYDEKSRLSALKTYSILDSHSDEDYSGLVSIAAKICEVPIAYISFMDDNRQWFKAKYGFDHEETDRKSSTCNYVLNRPDSYFEITDLTKDPDFKDKPLMAHEIGLKFYAGYIIRAGDGHPIGTLCFMDFEPRSFTDLQKEVVQNFGRQISKLLEFRKLAFRIKELQALEDYFRFSVDQFLFVTSHEFRAPLVNVESLVNLLFKKEELSREKTQRIHKMILKENRQVLDMVEGLIEFTNGSGRINRKTENFDLQETFHELAQESFHHLDPKITFDLGNPQVDHYREVFKAVFKELMTNSERYSRAEIPLQVAISSSSRNGQLNFRYEDNGLGIPNGTKLDPSKLFEVLHEQDRFGQRGRGIGLAKAYSLLRSIGGDLKVDYGLQHFDQGLGFIIHLPTRMYQGSRILNLTYE